MVGLLLLNNDPQDDPRSEPSGVSSSDETQTPVAPTEDSMTTFVETYLETADDDPASAFEMLTPDYQAESNGLAGYEGFWGNVVNVRVDSIDANVDDLTVTYTYTYNLHGGGNQSDTVLMQLEQTDDGFLISGAETVG